MTKTNLPREDVYVFTFSFAELQAITWDLKRLNKYKNEYNLSGPSQESLRFVNSCIADDVVHRNLHIYDHEVGEKVPELRSTPTTKK